MSSPIKWKFLSVSLILSTLFLFGCGSDRQKAEKLIAEGDALIETGNKLTIEGQQKLREYMSDAKMAGFPANREQIRGVAQEAADLLGKSSAAYHDAASKYEEVSKLDMKPAGKEFLSLKLQATHKLAESKDLAKQMALLPLDPSINDLRTLQSKVIDMGNRVQALSKEAKDLDARADKVKQDNP